MKKVKISIFLFLSALVFNAGAFTVPELTGPVVDQAQILSPQAKQRISQTLISEKQNGGPQVQVLTVKSLDDETTESAAIKVFDAWKLGKEKEDDGVLFLIAPYEKKLRIEVGQGLEGNIPDVIAKRIISDIVVPYFKRGEFDQGVMQGVTAILTYAHDPSQAQKQTEENKTEHFISKYFVFFILGIWIIIFILNPQLALLILFSGRGGPSGGGFGGGGGWSGGGGRSSGGGASGGW